MAFKLESEPDLTFDSMLSVAKHLGKSRVYRKDFDRFGIIEVDTEVETEIEEATDDVEEQTSTNIEEATDEVEEVSQEVEEQEEVVEALQDLKEVIEQSEVVEPEPVVEALQDLKEVIEQSEVVEPEPVVEDEYEEESPAEPTPAYVIALRKKAGIETIDELYKKIRGAKYEDVTAFAQSLDVFWDENPNPKVNRMNVAKALRESLFPGEKRPRRPKSAWHGTPLETLKELATTNHITIKEAENERVLRMWLVKSLKEVGIVEPPK